MKYVMCYTTVILLLFIVMLPITVTARTHNRTPLPPSVTQYDSAGAPTTQLQDSYGWHHQSAESQQQISALGTVPVANFPIPVLFGVGTADISPNFGDPRPTRLHEGEDIMAIKGTPIVSPTDAVVTLISLGASTGASEGNAVYTANPGGETFVYYHLDRVGEGLARGQVLARGSLIGYVGNTGDAAGGAAHLHFEIRTTAGNVANDPFPRLTEEFSIQEKITYLSVILTQSADPVALSRFLVSNFRGTFTLALAANISLPMPIIDALASIPAGGSPTSGALLPAGDLDVGSSGPLVVELQKYLIQAASGTAATRLAGAGATGNFGPITKTALVEFQTKFGIVPATGYYGATTRIFILAHPAGSLQPSTTPSGLPAGCTSAAGFSPLTGASCTSGVSLPVGNPTLTRNLQINMSGEDVRTLQKLLNAKGFLVALTGAGSLGNETIFFGPATRAAVIKFQIGRNITPAVGYVGPVTRAALGFL